MRKIKTILASLMAVVTVFVALALFAPTDSMARDTITPETSASFAVNVCDEQLPETRTRDVQNIVFGDYQASRYSENETANTGDAAVYKTDFGESYDARNRIFAVDERPPTRRRAERRLKRFAVRLNKNKSSPRLGR